MNWFGIHKYHIQARKRFPGEISTWDWQSEAHILPADDDSTSNSTMSALKITSNQCELYMVWSFNGRMHNCLPTGCDFQNGQQKPGTTQRCRPGQRQLWSRLYRLRQVHATPSARSYCVSFCAGRTREGDLLWLWLSKSLSRHTTILSLVRLSFLPRHRR